MTVGTGAGTLYLMYAGLEAAVWQRKRVFAMKKISLLAVIATVFLVATPAFALGGCTNSPENPTLVLAGLAGGVYGFRSLRTYLSARKSR